MPENNPYLIKVPLPLIPPYVTVHLGAPSSRAQNVTVPFVDYIKNVACSELFPTWPEEALIANINCQVSVTLNRIYTEWYRVRGYDFDITNSTAVDQSFVFGREIFQNISDLVDQIYNLYITKRGRFEPLYAQYCDGRVTQCYGLTQWGSVDLANQGYTSMEILRYYFGEDILLVEGTQTDQQLESYPGAPLSLGSFGANVIYVQLMLNRISTNYPSIPKIYPVNGDFTQATYDAVQQFQRIFSLTPDGIIGRATWNKLIYIFSAVKSLGELTSEGINAIQFGQAFEFNFEEGSDRPYVRLVQYFLTVVSQFYPTVPPVDITGFYGPATTEATAAFQREKGLNETGRMDPVTWEILYDSVVGIFSTIPVESIYIPRFPYPGYPLLEGSREPAVFIVQEYLNYISTFIPEIPVVEADGIYGAQTSAAVRAFEQLFELPVVGIVEEETYYQILDVYLNLRYGNERSDTQFPGQVLTIGTEDPRTPLTDPVNDPEPAASQKNDQTQGGIQS